jgi:hypothetical protein
VDLEADWPSTRLVAVQAVQVQGVLKKLFFKEKIKYR